MLNLLLALPLLACSSQPREGTARSQPELPDGPRLVMRALLKNLGLAVRGGNYHIFLKEQAKDTLI